MSKTGTLDLMNVIISILIVSLFSFFLYFTLFSSSRGNIEFLGKAYMEMESKDFLNDLYGIQYPVIGEDNQELMFALRYACQYSKGKDMKFFMSKTVPIILDPKSYLEIYLNKTFGENYYLYGNCTNFEMELGKKPPEDVDVISNKVMVPMPRGGYNEFLLLRWIG